MKRVSGGRSLPHGLRMPSGRGVGAMLSRDDDPALARTRLGARLSGQRVLPWGATTRNAGWSEGATCHPRSNAGRVVPSGSPKCQQNLGGVRGPSPIGNGSRRRQRRIRCDAPRGECTRRDPWERLGSLANRRPRTPRRSVSVPAPARGATGGRSRAREFRRNAPTNRASAATITSFRMRPGPVRSRRRPIHDLPVVRIALLGVPVSCPRASRARRNSQATEG